MKELENILTIFTGIVLLKIDQEGNILDVLINTQDGLDIKDIKNVYSLFSEEETTRVKRAIAMNFDGKKKYMELNKTLKIGQYVDVEVAEYGGNQYMFIQFFKSNRQREVEYERYVEGLMELSEKDALTQTFNRNGFMEKVRRVIYNSDPDKRIGVIFVDMDNLKHINDTYGHSIGDKAIMSIANILTSTVRQRDIVARLGGDEFVIVVEEVSGRKSTALGLAQRLLREIRKQNEKYSATASLGVHIFKAGKIIRASKNVENLEKLLSAEIKEADKAAYKAKDAGRNRICTSSGYSRCYKTLFRASV